MWCLRDIFPLEKLGMTWNMKSGEYDERRKKEEERRKKKEERSNGGGSGGSGGCWCWWWCWWCCCRCCCTNATTDTNPPTHQPHPPHQPHQPPRGMQSALATGLKAYDASSHSRRFDSEHGSAALVRACLSKFATVQLLRLQRDHHSSVSILPPVPPVPPVSASLPRASVELCCWLFQLLAEDGQVMFSSTSLRAITVSVQSVWVEEE